MAEIMRPFGLLGVPSSAGARTPGIEKAPEALRRAGILQKLQQAGRRVVDHGDLPTVRYRPDRVHPTAQNLERAGVVAAQLAKQISVIIDAGETPLVMGGDCSICQYQYVNVPAIFTHTAPVIFGNTAPRLRGIRYKMGKSLR